MSSDKRLAGKSSVPLENQGPIILTCQTTVVRITVSPVARQELIDRKPRHRGHSLDDVAWLRPGQNFAKIKNQGSNGTWSRWLHLPIGIAANPECRPESEPNPVERKGTGSNARPSLAMNAVMFSDECNQAAAAGCARLDRPDDVDLKHGDGPDMSGRHLCPELSRTGRKRRQPFDLQVSARAEQIEPRPRERGTSNRAVTDPVGTPAIVVGRSVVPSKFPGAKDHSVQSCTFGPTASTAIARPTNNEDSDWRKFESSAAYHQLSSVTPECAAWIPIAGNQE